MLKKSQTSYRLSDRIFAALDMAIQQEDVAIAELLLPALERSMTRNAGGGEFVERRNYPDELVEVIDRLEKLKKADVLAARASL
ncbi:MAG: hypothetical protein CL570_06410 [Alphaproteobacteria bacterium]|nr:hypothetical protein [Alphaproteobacteria bacterium]|tara:strand:- start:418 stop:669 length:252 start_codon:yes stop_codon:yes gene_type:complete